MIESNPQDLVIGSYTNYTWNQIKYWANSIIQSGFQGEKAVIVYNSDGDTVKNLQDLGFTIWAFNQDATTGRYFYSQDLVIVVQRFYHLWYFLASKPRNHYRYVIATDVKDVVFQYNPVRWLEKNIGDKKIIASSEGLQYRNEPWGADNFFGSYPFYWDRIQDSTIYNCGVQAGIGAAMQDLWLQIWLTCHAAQRPNADQAAFNMLLSSSIYKEITKFACAEDGWACQAGTTVDPEKIAGFLPVLLEPVPLWNGKESTTSTGTIHAVLHQYDRVPAWKREIEQKYA
jgi:hypothetical protein